MLDWLKSPPDDAPATLGQVAARAALALFLGFAVAVIYRFSVPKRASETAAVPTTLVLLCILMSLVTQVIGGNVARAFGLVGALSIVRFRTVVEDTRDTAFVVFAVVVGMAVGTDNWNIAYMSLPAVAAGALIMRWIAGRREPTGPAVFLVIRLGLGHDPAEALAPVLGKHLTGARIVSSGTARQGAALELTYTGRLITTGSVYALTAELNRTEGVQNVEVREKTE